MNANKIEIYWNLVSEKENQWGTENEFNCRIKSDDFDFVIGGITINQSKIDNRNALNIIARELTTPPIERKKPIIFDWFSSKKKKGEEK